MRGQLAGWKCWPSHHAGATKVIDSGNYPSSGVSRRAPSLLPLKWMPRFLVFVSPLFTLNRYAMQAYAVHTPGPVCGIHENTRGAPLPPADPGGAACYRLPRMLASAARSGTCAPSASASGKVDLRTLARRDRAGAEVLNGQRTASATGLSSDTRPAPSTFEPQPRRELPKASSTWLHSPAGKSPWLRCMSRQGQKAGEARLVRKELHLAIQIHETRFANRCSRGLFLKWVSGS